MTNEQIEKLGKLGEALERISQYVSAGGRYNEPWFSKEFILKNILGFTNEEYEQNEKMLEDLAAKRLAKQKRIEALAKIKDVDCDFDCMDDVADCCEISTSRPMPLAMAKTRGR